jgi:hypothetical protein
MGVCDACGKGEGTHHVTVRVTVFGPKATKTKVVQFWLCADCEVANQQVLADDANRRQRVAMRMTRDPEFFSRWREWRRKSAAEPLPSPARANGS